MTCNTQEILYATPAMPRGKRTVYAGFCPETGDRICTIRLHKKDKSDFKITRYSPRAKKRVEVKLKEEKHSK